MLGADVLSQVALLQLDASRRSPSRAHAVKQARHGNFVSDAEDQRHYGDAVEASVGHRGP